MTVTYDITDNVGKVRLKIGDNVLADPKFTDEELGVFLSNNSNNINLASAEALEAWAASYAANADSEGIGDYNYKQTIVTKMLKMARELRAVDASTPVFEWSEPNLSGEEDV